MATKKGIALTVAIIGGFTAASFLVYLVPTQPQDQMIIANPADELASAMERNDAIVQEFQSSFNMWKDGGLDSAPFDEGAELTVKQASDIAIELRQSRPPQGWVHSYALFVRAIEGYVAYFEDAREYVRYASGDGAEQEEAMISSIEEALAKADDLAKEARDSIP